MQIEWKQPLLALVGWMGTPMHVIHIMHTIVLASYSYFIILTTKSKKWKQILSIFIGRLCLIGTVILLFVDICVHKKTTQEVKNFDQMFEKMFNILVLAFFKAYYASMDASIMRWASTAHASMPISWLAGVTLGLHLLNPANMGHNFCSSLALTVL